MPPTFDWVYRQNKDKPKWWKWSCSCVMNKIDKPVSCTGLFIANF